MFRHLNHSSWPTCDSGLLAKLYLAAFLSPLYVYGTTAKGKTVPVVAHIVLHSLKLPVEVSDTVCLLLHLGHQLMDLVHRVMMTDVGADSSGPEFGSWSLPAHRVALGHIMRKAGSKFDVVINLALVLSPNASLATTVSAFELCRRWTTSPASGLAECCSWVPFMKVCLLSN